MIGQYLSNKNENATVAKSEIFSELNKAHGNGTKLLWCGRFRRAPPSISCLEPWGSSAVSFRGGRGKPNTEPKLRGSSAVVRRWQPG